jgi:hypothetical protein
MAHQNDDSMIERTLVRLLCPGDGISAQHRESSLKKMRRNKRSCSDRTHTAERLAQPSRIFVHEVLSSRTLSVYWSDSQTGHYAEQIWRVGLARHDSFCALSGKPIHSGDEVFRPRRSVVLTPANWDRMILASVAYSPLHREQIRPGERRAKLL